MTAPADVRIVLVRPKLAANVGAAARAMKNFGQHDLVLVAPRCELDREAYALASHADDVLDACRVVDTLDEALADRTWVIGTSARERASDAVRSANLPGAVDTLPPEGGAILFGPEDHGLANEELDRCAVQLRIETAAYASINLAQAVNLVAHAVLARTAVGDEARLETPTPAPREDVERMIAQLVELWHLIGYTDDLREEATARLFRGMFDRAALRPREVAALRGLWAQAAWAAERRPEDLPGRKERPEGR